MSSPRTDQVHAAPSDAPAAPVRKNNDSAYDTDGDGKLGPIEQCMKKYDTDGSGSFNAAEVKAIIQDLEESKETARNLTRLLALFALAFIGLCGVMLGVVCLGNEASKENHVNEDSALTDLDGNAVGTDAVESFSDLYDLPYMETSALAKLNALTFYVQWDDTNANRATFAPSGAYQISTDVVALTTPEGFTITIDGTTDAEAATLTMGSNTYPIYISEARRRVRARARRLAAGRREAPKLLSKHDWEAHKRAARQVTLDEEADGMPKLHRRKLQTADIDDDKDPKYSYDYVIIDTFANDDDEPPVTVEGADTFEDAEATFSVFTKSKDDQ